MSAEKGTVLGDSGVEVDIALVVAGVHKGLLKASEADPRKLLQVQRG